MDVPKHALRPTLLSALERIEALKEARKVDGEKIEMAIKELKESAKLEQTLKNEIERLLEVEKSLQNLHAELNLGVVIRRYIVSDFSLDWAFNF